MGRKRTPQPYSVKAREVGSELRKQRESADMSLRQLAVKLGWPHPNLSFIESGARPASATDVARYLGGCGPVKESDYEWLVKLAAEPDNPSLIRSREPSLRSELRSLIVQENAADTIIGYEPNVIDGLLQTETYAHDLMCWGGLLTPGNVELRVRARMARQGIFQRRDSPRFLFFLQEHAIRTVVGDARRMHEQVLCLLLAGAQPGCSVRVVPDSAGPFSAWNSFRVMDYEKYPSIVYTEGMTTGTFLEAGSDVGTHRRMLAHIDRAALAEEDTRAWLTRLAAAYDRAEDLPPAARLVTPH